jgi:hypothetical protein
MSRAAEGIMPGENVPGFLVLYSSASIYLNPGSGSVCFAIFAKSFAYFAARTERQSKTAKVAKPDAKFRKEKL